MDQRDQGQRDLAAIRDTWLSVGTCTEPADRNQAESGVRDAFRAVGHDAPSLMFIWVQSPMAGVLASTYVGFALGEPLNNLVTTHLNAALVTNVPAAQRVRREVDEPLRQVARTAVHQQIEAELAARGTGWEKWKNDMGNYAWDQVWQTVGDQVYCQGWDQQARTSEGVFEANLAPWADAMMDGQFDAGAMAQLDVMHLVDGTDLTPFAGLQRVARNCGWWWGFEAGAVLCERPSRFEVSDGHVTIEFRDGWSVRT